MREIRKSKSIGQKELIGLLQLEGVSMKRETLDKIKRVYSAYTS